MKMFSSKRRWSGALQGAGPGQAHHKDLLPQGRKTQGSGQMKVSNHRMQAEFTTWKVLCGCPGLCIALLLLPTLFSFKVLGPVRLEAGWDPKSLSHTFSTTHQVCFLKINSKSVYQAYQQSFWFLSQTLISTINWCLFRDILSHLYIAKAERKFQGTPFLCSGYSATGV